MLAYLFAGLWNAIWIPAVVAVTHILIDGMKARYEDNIKSFIADQFGHLAVLLAIWVLIINPGYEDLAVLEQFMNDTRVWIIIAAYLVVIWPAGVLISKMTVKWRNDIFEKGDEDSKSLENAGRWIGRLERFLILTFVLLEQYAAIGFLVAAKSIFRFNVSRKVSEYILIGTLLSFVTGIVVGLVVSLFL